LVKTSKQSKDIKSELYNLFYPILSYQVYYKQGDTKRVLWGYIYSLAASFHFKPMTA